MDEQRKAMERKVVSRGLREIGEAQDQVKALAAYMERVATEGDWTAKELRGIRVALAFILDIPGGRRGGPIQHSLN